jgi:hypothetical protein
MLHVRLKSGAPDEPDTGDWNAICATPSIRGFFEILFHEVAGFSLPAEVVTSDTEDDVRRTQTGWRGSRELGAEIKVVSCTETTDLPTYCWWETYGLPGMKIKWNYSLEYAGQLGHVAFRHGALDCEFAMAVDQQRFAGIWKKAIGKEPVFEAVTPGET